MGLRLKFNLILLASFLVGLAAASALFYRVARDNALDRLPAEISVLRSQALAVRKYTSEEIRPLLADMSSVQFLPQTVPSFSAQTVFTHFRETYPEFYYKEAALNPTNPSDLAEPWERQLIERLRADASLKEIAEVRETAGSRHFTVAFPLVIKSEGCLSCHSTPDKAPASMTALYGKQNGFGWKLNETVGAQIVSVPMALVDTQAWANLKLMVAALSAIFLMLLGLINALLSHMVVTPIMAMARTAEQVSMGDSSPPEFTHAGTDEIAKLSVSFNRMRRSLDSAMKLLEA